MPRPFNDVNKSRGEITHNGPFVSWEVMRSQHKGGCNVHLQRRSGTGEGRAGGLLSGGSGACLLTAVPPNPTPGINYRTCQHLKGRQGGTPRGTNWFHF